MQSTPPVQKAPKRVLIAFFASVGLGLVLATMLAFLASYHGLLFSGLDSFVTILLTTGICAFVTMVTALVFKRRGRRFGTTNEVYAFISG